MKWLKKLLGLETPTPTTAPADAGAKAFDQMAKTLSAPEEKVVVAPVVALEVQAVATKVDEAIQEVYKSTDIPIAEVSADISAEKPKAPRKPRAKKDPISPLPQTVAQNVGEWPFPGNPPAEGMQKAKPASRKVKAK
jgi:hypothetical protein